MQVFKKDESTAARRRMFFYLVDATDGLTEEPGITIAGADLQISKNGGTFANMAGTVTELANGVYYYEFTAGELDTLGPLGIRIADASSRTRFIECQVVAYDPYDTVRLGLTCLPNAVVNASNGLHTIGTSAGQIQVDGSGNAFVDVKEILTVAPTLTTNRLNVNVQAISDNAATADNLELFYSNALVGTVNDASATTSSFIISSGFSATNDFYNGSYLVFTTGALAGLARVISDYVGATKTVSFSYPTPSAPANGVGVMILGRKN